MMKLWLLAGCVASVVGLSVSLGEVPVVPREVDGEAGVKAYLLETIGQVTTATADLKAAAGEYEALAAAHNNSIADAAKSEPEKVSQLVQKMRDAYQRIDSFGYEYVEGIVAGVPFLAKYDVELDAGLPATGASPEEDVAPVVVRAGELVLDREGSLNNFLIEPTVFGTNPKFIDGTAPLPGFDLPVGLPKPKLISALADYAIDGYARLKADAEAWQPSPADCFQVVVSMTPTLADYFEDWKETRKHGSASGGRFVAVSRLSDMRGIMSSTRLAWMAVADDVKAKDAALADNIIQGYDQILSFLDTIEAREADSPWTVETIDALGSQAKEKADKLTVQGAQAAALVGAEVN